MTSPEGLDGPRPTHSTRRTGHWLPGAGLIVIAVVFMVGGAALLLVNQARLAESVRWVEHTQHVLLRATDLGLALVDAEAATRALILTGNDTYRADFEDARGSVASQVSELAASIRDNPDQAQRLQAMTPLIERRLERFGSLVSGTEDQRAALMARAEVEQAQALGRSLRARLDAFRAAEVALLNERNQEATRNASWFSLLALLTGGAGMGIAVVGFVLLQQERSRHRIRELQSELHHLARLTTIGQTASMLAHEIKQPLTAAVTYLEVAARQQETASQDQGLPPGKAAETLQKAAVQVRRASDIVGRLRGFVDKRESRRGVEPVRDLIEDAVVLLGSLGASARLEVDVPSDLPPLSVDRVQVQQVLVNLMRNAVEAMSGSPRRDLKVSARAEGGWIEIAVADSGPGLPEGVRSQLFKPFVSTKPDGMGVGLSICRTIVTEHGGKVWADPAAEGGTVFRFTLPVARDSSAA